MKITLIIIVVVSPVITEVNILTRLILHTHYTIHAKTNKMYEYALTEGQMIKLFLTEYNTIQIMTEKEFIDWFKAKLIEVSCEETVEEFTVTEVIL